MRPAHLLCKRWANARLSGMFGLSLVASPTVIISFSYYLCVAPIRVLYFRDKDAYIELPVDAARRELSKDWRIR
jgi:hypothetical protein